MRSVIRLLPLALLGAALAACGGSSGSDSGSPPDGASQPQKQHFANDFEPACEGVAMSTARAYDKAAAGHKVVYFMTNKEGGLVDVSTQLPQDWWVKFETNSDAYGEVDLVICAKRTSQTFVKDCDGYKVDDQPSPLVVRWHTARYLVTVHEAATGKELAAKEIAATDADCPMFYSIPDDTERVDDFASPPDEQIVAFAKPFVQP